MYQFPIGWTSKFHTFQDHSGNNSYRSNLLLIYKNIYTPNKHMLTCGGSNPLTVHHITHWHYVLYESVPF